MHNIKANFDKLFEVIKEIMGNEIGADGNFLRPGPKPRFTDIEVIILGLTSECLSIDSETFFS